MHVAWVVQNLSYCRMKIINLTLYSVKSNVNNSNTSLFLFLFNYLYLMRYPFFIIYSFSILLFSFMHYITCKRHWKYLIIIQFNTCSRPQKQLLKRKQQYIIIASLILVSSHVLLTSRTFFLVKPSELKWLICLMNIQAVPKLQYLIIETYNINNIVETFRAHRTKLNSSITKILLRSGEW